MDRRVTPTKRVTSPTWGPPPPSKRALSFLISHHIEKTPLIKSSSPYVLQILIKHADASRQQTETSRYVSYSNPTMKSLLIPASAVRMSRYEAPFTPLSCSSNFSRASYLDICTLTHEAINCLSVFPLVNTDAHGSLNQGIVFKYLCAFYLKPPHCNIINNKLTNTCSFTFFSFSCRFFFFVFPSSFACLCFSSESLSELLLLLLLLPELLELEVPTRFLRQRSILDLLFRLKKSETKQKRKSESCTSKNKTPAITGLAYPFFSHCHVTRRLTE